jgi:hypothetical protein
MRESILPLWPVLAKSKKRRLVLAMAVRRLIPNPLERYEHSLAAADASKMPFLRWGLVKAALSNPEFSTSATRNLLRELEEFAEQLKAGRANAA